MFGPWSPAASMSKGGCSTKSCGQRAKNSTDQKAPSSFTVHTWMFPIIGGPILGSLYMGIL